MTTLHEAAQQALEALENFARFQRMMMDGPDASDKLLAEDYAETAFLQGAQAIPALRSALAQQPELSTTSKSEQLLASHDHALRAEFQRMKAALAQQGEQQLFVTGCSCKKDEFCDECSPDIFDTAPAAQPTCKQDLQVPTVKENLTVETEQERYVRMCPDIECGRKKRCTRMVGVSCMSRADIAPAAQPDDAIVRAWQAGYYHAGYTNDQAYADKMAREYAGAAPAVQPDTWTDDGGWTFPIEGGSNV